MPRAFRPLSFAVIGILALACSACSSNNEGKIVGKWKNSAQHEGLPPGSVFFEFTADGKVIMTVLGMQALTAKYKLGTGDYLTLSDVNVQVPTADKSERGGRIKVTIKGDNLTWVEKGTTIQMVRDK